jgi:allantoicase
MFACPHIFSLLQGNYADSVEILYASDRQFDDDTSDIEELKWKPLMRAKKLSAHKRIFYMGEDLHMRGDKLNSMTHCKIIIKPDGGISRIRKVFFSGGSGSSYIKGC